MVCVSPAAAPLESISPLLDLPKHRLDRLLAQPIRAVIALGGNLLGHGGEPAALLGFPCSRRRGAVLLPAGRDKPVDLTFLFYRGRGRGLVLGASLQRWHRALPLR
jgi:hypothetical protein